MAQAPVEAFLSEHAPSPTTATALFPRNDDPMTVALRSQDPIDFDDIVRLNRAASPSHDGSSTIGTLTTAVFSSYKESSGTKPTSAGTSYPVGGKGKAVATYASSLSATHGSISEAEAGKEHTFVGIGDWVAREDSDAVRRLRGSARARKRPRISHPKHKKPVVVIQQDIRQDSPYLATSEDEDSPIAESISRHNNNNNNNNSNNNKETNYLRRRTNSGAHDCIALAEEGRAPLATEHPKARLQPLSRARFYTLIAILVVAALTLALSTFAAHYTGKARIACTKGIIFSATVLMSFFTVLAMVVARRALQEALLAGLLEFLIGFALVVEIHEFM
ncbi:hypothetical protein P280DRAFT_516019 [Massarina eburnea CBS 473.64]|uniref:Uncharacterized protein n=1 Tax=Massarina eburnea CBS 473.64 TaxID=1395130 RepID=A0A6A6S6Y5_9PLEO|nr:hypothetical protein P280DRAFT_516019 [Massarina eburnea CBS 473.64]